MKLLKYALFAMATILFVSCSDDDNSPIITNETDGLLPIKTLHNDTHSINIFTKSGTLLEGYNQIFFQLKDHNNNYINDASIEWNPIMYMHGMSHTCPFSAVTKLEGKQTLYQGYIIFQMASNDMEYWELTFDYTVEGITYQISERVDVFQSEKRRVSSFVGSDEQQYLVALIEPSDPKVALNDMIAGIFKMENHHHYSVVNHHTLEIDPRMPGMGNHGSPNNQHLTQSTDGFYHGKLSLTMTGYWKINLKLKNQNEDVLKGESVTETQPSSSIFFEIEF